LFGLCWFASAWGGPDVETTPRIDDDGPQWLAGTDGVHVDARSLADFGATLRADLERTVFTHLRVIGDKVDATTGSVGAAAPEVSRARTLLDDHLAECLAGLAEHATAAYRLAQAAEEIGKRYTDVDAYAAAREDDVAALLPPVRPADSGHTFPGRPW
jgi:hypothetical protein